MARGDQRGIDIGAGLDFTGTMLPPGTRKMPSTVSWPTLPSRRLCPGSTSSNAPRATFSTVARAAARLEACTPAARLRPAPLRWVSSALTASSW